jgi:eukaryotic-like serine/threonine-protein kinase
MTMTEQSEQNLGNYRLLSLIGQGGFADVYLGEHIYLKTRAAIKVLRTQLAQEDMNNFLVEARTIAHLLHPNIVRVLECGIENNTPFLVMDYAPNGTLRKRYPRGTQLPLGIIVPTIKQVAGALQYAHDQRIVHRDIKPENMLIGAQDEILLSDFGIATMAQSSHYQTRDIVGTVSYMAPEQIQGKPRPASDQYALGIIAYEWLTGACPYHGSFTEVAAQQMYAPLPPLRAHLPNVASDVEQVITIALAKDPERRFSSVQAFARALEQASGGEETVHISDSTVLPAMPPGAPPRPAPAAIAPAITPVVTPVTPLPTIFAYPNTPPPEVYAPPVQYPPSPDAPQPQRHTRRYVLFAGLGALALATSGIAAWELLHHPAPAPITGITPTSAPAQTPTAPPNPTATTPPNPTATALPSVPTIATYAGPGNMFTVSWSPTNTPYVASAGLGANIEVWQAVAGTPGPLPYTTQAGRIFRVAWSPNGQYIAAGMDQGNIQIWDTSSGQSIFNKQAHNKKYVNCVAWSPNGSLLVSGGGDGTAIVWDVAAQMPTVNYTSYTKYINAVAWSHNGEWIVSGGADSTAQVWNASDGSPFLTYTLHSDDIMALAWSLDDSLIASASDDGTVQIWDSSSGSRNLTYLGHRGFEVVAMDWSPDGTLIASGGTDSVVHVWEAATGSLQRKYYGHTDEIEGVAWSPNSKQVASASDDGTVRIWPGR